MPSLEVQDAGVLDDFAIVLWGFNSTEIEPADVEAHVVPGLNSSAFTFITEGSSVSADEVSVKSMVDVLYSDIPKSFPLPSVRVYIIPEVTLPTSISTVAPVRSSHTGV